MAPRKSDPRDKRTLDSLREALNQKAALDRIADEEADQVAATEGPAKAAFRARRQRGGQQ